MWKAINHKEKKEKWYHREGAGVTAAGKLLGHPVFLAVVDRVQGLVAPQQACVLFSEQFLTFVLSRQ